MANNRPQNSKKLKLIKMIIFSRSVTDTEFGVVSFEACLLRGLSGFSLVADPRFGRQTNRKTNGTGGIIIGLGRGYPVLVN